MAWGPFKFPDKCYLLSLYLGLDQLLDLVLPREAMGLQFGVCQLSIDGYLEPALSRGDEVQGIHLLPKFP